MCMDISLSPPCRQQQHRRKVRGRQRDPSTPERGRNAFGRLKHYHRRDYHLSAVSSSVFPGAFAGCNNLAFQRYNSAPPPAAALPKSSHRDMSCSRTARRQEQPAVKKLSSLGQSIPASLLYTLLTQHLTAVKSLLCFKGKGR